MIRRFVRFLRTPSPQRDAFDGLLWIVGVPVAYIIAIWVLWPR